MDRCGQVMVLYVHCFCLYRNSLCSEAVLSMTFENCMHGGEVERISHLPKLCFLCSLGSSHAEVGLMGYL